MKPKRCFVISPIGDEGSARRGHADDVFRFIIKPAMEAFGVEPVRSDHISESGQISEQMFREILQADLCVAVLTGHNPNVFYELAVAQCAARPVLILIERGEPLPFDVQDLRCVEYEMQPIGRLVDGTYADRVKEQIQSLDDAGWTMPGLFERYRFGPRLRSEQQLKRLVETAMPEPLESGRDAVYRLPEDPEREIVLLTGDLSTLEELPTDAIVCLQDTHLQPARYFENVIPGSISGTLRYLDARKTPDGRIARDSMQVALQERISELGIVLPVMPGTVVATPTDGLAPLGIRYVLHVAAIQGAVGDGYAMMDHILDDCIRGALDSFAELAREEELETLLFPMLGAASTRLEPEAVARQILVPILTKLPRLPACRTIYVLAWLDAHRHAFRRVAAELGLEEVPAGPVAVASEPADGIAREAA